MISIETITDFFGWCSMIHIGLYFLSTTMVITIRGLAVRVHGRMFNLDEQSLSKIYLQYLGQYKLFALVVPILP